MTTTIYVKPDDESFDSVAKIVAFLQARGAVTGCSVDNGRIRVKDYVFIKGEADEEDADETVLMDVNGASWFESLRKDGQTIATSKSATWKEIREQMLLKFYEGYSFLEYIQDESNTAKVAETARADKETLARVFGKFSGETPDSAIERKGQDYSDLYGATVKLSITDGVSEVQTVLARLLFRRVGDSWVPIEKAIADNVLNSLKHFDTQPSGYATYRDEGEIRAVKNDILAQLTMFINGSNGVHHYNIVDYLVYRNEYDLRTIGSLLGKDIDVLTCIHAEAVSLFHVRWRMRCYDVYVNSRLAFLCQFGFGNTLSIGCAICKKNIIDDNFVTLEAKDEHSGRLVTRKISFLPNEDNFGLSEADSKSVAKLFSEHAFLLNCTDRMIAHAPCRKLVCRDNCLVFKGDEDSEELLICKNCDCAEVTSLVNGELYLTEDLSFDRFGLALTMSGNVVTCSICGRQFALEYMVGHRCHACDALVKGENASAMRALYRRYSYMFPHTVRLFSGKPKYCVEDEEIVLFRMGTKYYRFYKMEKPTLYLQRPEELVSHDE